MNYISIFFTIDSYLVNYGIIHAEKGKKKKKKEKLLKNYY